MSKSESLIIEREVVELGDSQNRMITSGWGKDTLKKSVVEKLTYLSDGLKVKGFLAYPKDISEKYPCIIWNRGGVGEKGAIDSFMARGLFGQLASWGYVVFASQYRGNAGGEGKDEFGGDDVNDVLNLIPLANEFNFADTENWGIEGWSRGGMMTYLALTRSNHPDGLKSTFKCAIVTGGIANLRCSSDESVFMRRLYEMQLG
jgi:dipeptidyl aminopeptidase/acylaminoacyl peptidase